jgi:mono/diheme cytochrome c family protein
MRIFRILIAILAAGFCAAWFAEEPDLDPDVREGRRLYEYYCVSCHGDKGRGDGFTSKVLRVKPTDLTRLTKRNGGEFPLERVTRSIDGRARTPSHGTAMPIWGLGFQDPHSDVNQEDEVNRRIECLIEYIKSMQK